MLNFFFLLFTIGLGSLFTSKRSGRRTARRGGVFMKTKFKAEKNKWKQKRIERVDLRKLR